MASAAPPPPPPPGNSGSLLGSSAVITAKEFSHSISQELNNSNYLLWCQQLEPVLKEHRLFHLVTKPHIPPQYLTIADHDAGVVSSEFLLWEQRISSFCRGFNPLFLVRCLGLVGCKTAWYLWDKLHTHFHSIVRAKKRQLCNDLHNIFLNNSSISDYLFRIQTIIDSHSSIGEYGSESDHVDIFLDGLPDEFKLLIACEWQV